MVTLCVAPACCTQISQHFWLPYLKGKHIAVSHQNFVAWDIHLLLSNNSVIVLFVSLFCCCKSSSSLFSFQQPDVTVSGQIAQQSISRYICRDSCQSVTWLGGWHFSWQYYDIWVHPFLWARLQIGVGKSFLIEYPIALELRPLMSESRRNCPAVPLSPPISLKW